MSKVKINWKSAVGEIIYIFLGITLAIMFQNWNEDRKEQKLVNKLTNALYAENLVNLKVLPETMDQTASVLNSTLDFMALMGEDYQSKEVKIVDSLMFHFLLSPKFNASQEVIQEITESGKLETIKDDSLRKYIVQWNLLKKRTETMESINMKQNAEQIMPYLQTRYSILSMDHRYAQLDDPFPPSAFKVDNRKILADFRFENLLEMQFYSMSYQQEFQKELLTLITTLHEHLKTKVE